VFRDIVIISNEIRAYVLSSRAATNKRGAIGSGTLFKQCSGEPEHKHFMLELRDEIHRRGAVT
jgi:hypothetical protein